MNITPDSIIYFQYGWFKLNATIVFTWAVMAVIVIASLVITSRLKKGPKISRWQASLETIVSVIRSQIKDVMKHDPMPYLPFIGSLFIFISIANFLDIVPGYQPPTGSLYTSGGLAICVFFAVPFFGIRRQGVLGYFMEYIRPTPIMLPFNIISEFSRTLSMAIRLFGNMMSGTMIVAILLTIAPLFLPVLLQILGLIIGQLQAYIFGILATVYIASGISARKETKKENKKAKSQKGE
ncbi:MAG: F0F1 ATP synthase subunit A [Spirochaetia bacterium]